MIQANVLLLDVSSNINKDNKTYFSANVFDQDASSYNKAQNFQISQDLYNVLTARLNDIRLKPVTFIIELSKFGAIATKLK